MLPYISSKHTNQAGDASKAVAAKNWSVDPSIATKSVPFVLVCIIVACANWTTQIASFFPTYIDSLTAVGVTTFVTGAALATFTMVGQAVCKIILGASVDFSPIKAVFAACGIGVIAILLVWMAPETIMLPIGGFIFGMFYATPVVLSPLIGGAIFGTGKEYSVIWGRTMLPSNLLACPAGFVWPLLAENFGGFDVVFIGGIILICVFAIGATVAIKLGKRLPHIVPETPVAQPNGDPGNEKQD